MTQPIGLHQVSFCKSVTSACTFPTVYKIQHYTRLPVKGLRVRVTVFTGAAAVTRPACTAGAAGLEDDG